MVAVKLLAAVTLVLAFAARCLATGCAECTFAGPPGSPRRCIPNGGILVFNSVPPSVPAYWTLFADADGARSLRRLEGELAVWSDVPAPGVPGFPGRPEGEVYVGASARFVGVVQRRRVRAVATWADGATCTFSLRLAFGSGSPKPNRFLCRDPAGVVVAEGRLDLQGIRLRGCRRQPAAG